jgi:hypothetical protein
MVARAKQVVDEEAHITQELVWVAARRVPMKRRPYRIWTLNNYSKTDPPQLPMKLVHHVNAFLEDEIHDWTWEGDHIRYFSRSFGPEEEGRWIVAEYDNTPTGFVFVVWAQCDNKKKPLQLRMRTPIAEFDAAWTNMVDKMKERMARQRSCLSPAKRRLCVLGLDGGMTQSASMGHLPQRSLCAASCTLIFRMRGTETRTIGGAIRDGRSGKT